jgi:hypothetical protein
MKGERENRQTCGKVYNILTSEVRFPCRIRKEINIFIRVNKDMSLPVIYSHFTHTPC